MTVSLCPADFNAINRDMAADAPHTPIYFGKDQPDDLT